MKFKIKRQKFGPYSLFVMLLIGGAFTAIGLLIYQSVHIDKNWLKVSGVAESVSNSISDGTQTYSPIVKYEVNSVTYKVGGLGSSAYPNVGDTREVAYNPSNPAQSKVIEGNGTKAIILFFPFIGICLLILGPFLFIRSIVRSKKINDLTKTGTKLQGVLVDIQTAGGQNGSYRIVVSADDGAGNVQNYVSDSLDGVAGLAMADFKTNPIPIDVYIDSLNHQNYYVDISDIPNLSVERIGELIKKATQFHQQQTITTPTPITAVQNQDNILPK